MGAPRPAARSLGARGPYTSSATTLVVPGARHLEVASRPTPALARGPVARPERSFAPSIGLLSSFPPTPCGIATFTSALGGALVDQGHDVGVVRVLDTPEAAPPGGLTVLGELVASDPASIPGAARALNERDVVLLQHEYGLYGGRDGADVLEVLDAVRAPVIATLHTVLAHPSANQRAVLEAVVRRADRVVVMTERARAILTAVHDLGATPVSVIPHGATMVAARPPDGPRHRPLLLTWGLLGPTKGIQWVIEALAGLRDLDPMPRYVVAGRTHPKILARDGDAYRQSLIDAVARHGLGDVVTFENSYRDLASLGALIQSADVVVLPYDSLDQATSGVLVDAVAAGRPVIATAFPHAVELLGSGAGIVVDQGDVTKIAAAIRSVLSHPSLARTMASEARRLAPQLSWDAVAAKYRHLAGRLVARSATGV